MSGEKGCGLIRKKEKQFPVQVAGKIFEAKEKGLGEHRVTHNVSWSLWHSPAF